MTVIEDFEVAVSVGNKTFSRRKKNPVSAVHNTANMGLSGIWHVI